jgi:hypothetical protein
MPKSQLAPDYFRVHEKSTGSTSTKFLGPLGQNNAHLAPWYHRTPLHHFIRISPSGKRSKWGEFRAPKIECAEITFYYHSGPTGRV